MILELGIELIEAYCSIRQPFECRDLVNDLCEKTICFNSKWNSNN